MNTSLFLYTPSKSIKIFFPLSDPGSVNVLRYQPMPPLNAPPPFPVGLVLSKGSSTLQSCGRLSLRHESSLKVADEAKGLSPKKNFQLSLNLSVVLDCAFTNPYCKEVTNKNSKMIFFIFLFN